ncbi:hypothetical protein RHMOL_Rhmol01G0003600 [Rhododendron molle]|uniref:Uncharacterized protein n=1 Tax=Rhododendron molle TaxID=49168 RepID=A0ACC0PX48_RHOML|nr:hypothetical protein RHMOL_Rhmol01G0003600 [Rhododendron molle]
MTTTSSGSSSTPVIVSGEDDVPIYLRVYRNETYEGGPGFFWYVIKTMTDCFNGFGASYEKVSPPVFKQEPGPRDYPGCVSVGGTLYVLGGMDSKPPSSFFGVHNLSPPGCDVFYIDTTTLCCPEEGVVSGGGWKKLDHSMNVPRTCPHAFAINGKIYVMGGQQSPKPEVLDTRRMEEGWRELQDSTDVPGQIDGHAVIDGGKRIVVQSRYEPHLYCYDVEADSWQVYLEHVIELPTWQPAFLDWKSAFLDGILYYLDHNRPGVMFGIDVSRPHDAAEPKRVRLPLGSKCEDWGWHWIPQPIPENSDLALPTTHLVSLGSGKLGVLWSAFSPFRSKKHELHVYCSTIKMSKEEKKHEEGGGDDDFDLVARPLSLSHVLVHGSALEDCLAVFPSQTMGPLEYVDDSIVSANHKNSTGGSNNKKNGSKKKRKKKGRLRGSENISAFSL